MTGAPRKPAGDDLFRDEAVQDYLQARTRGQLLRISPAWSAWLFWVIAAAAAGGLLFVSTVHVDQWVHGSGVVVARDGRLEVAAFLPASARALLAPGQELLVRLDGADAPIRARVDAPGAEIVSPAGVRERLGAAADLLPLAGPSVPLRVAVPDPTPAAVPGATGVVEVRVGRRTLLASLLPEGAP